MALLTRFSVSSAGIFSTKYNLNLWKQFRIAGKQFRITVYSKRN